MLVLNDDEGPRAEVHQILKELLINPSTILLKSSGELKLRLIVGNIDRFRILKLVESGKVITWF